MIEKEICGFTLTKHAAQRCNQRGITQDELTFLLENFDRSFSRPGNIEQIEISSRQCKKLRKSGHPNGLIERVAHIRLRVSFEGKIITPVKKH